MIDIIDAIKDQKRLNYGMQLSQAALDEIERDPIDRFMGGSPYEF